MLFEIVWDYVSIRDSQGFYVFDKTLLNES
jgi:hypothetical protein